MSKNAAAKILVLTAVVASLLLIAICLTQRAHFSVGRFLRGGDRYTSANQHNRLSSVVEEALHLEEEASVGVAANSSDGIRDNEERRLLGSFDDVIREAAAANKQGYFLGDMDGVLDDDDSVMAGTESNSTGEDETSTRLPRRETNSRECIVFDAALDYYMLTNRNSYLVVHTNDSYSAKQQDKEDASRDYELVTSDNKSVHFRNRTPATSKSQQAEDSSLGRWCVVQVPGLPWYWMKSTSNGKVMALKYSNDSSELDNQ